MPTPVVSCFVDPETRETKAKISYWDFTKIQSFCTVKEIINRTKRQPVEWEKIFANDISDKGLVSKIYHIFFIHSSISGHLGYFHILTVQMAIRHMKRCPASVIVREKQIKTTMS